MRNAMTKILGVSTPPTIAGSATAYARSLVRSTGMPANLRTEISQSESTFAECWLLQFISRPALRAARGSTLNIPNSERFQTALVSKQSSVRPTIPAMVFKI